MKIKIKLVILFTVLVAGINAFSLVIIYLSSADFRKEQFYDRLNEKAINTAKLLVDVEEIDQELLQIIDENTASLPQEQVTVIDFNNEIIYQNPATGNSLLTSELIDQIRLETRVDIQIGEKEAVGILYVGEYDRFVVLALAYDQYGIGKLVYLKWVLIIVFLITIVIVGGAGWLFVRQSFLPVNRVIEEVNQISEQSLGKRLDEGNGKDELAHLAQTFNRMLDRLEHAFITQKGFVSYASHELRTPLTAILGQIEVALLSDRQNEEYKDLIRSINEELLKLKKLTNGLLRLFQLSSGPGSVAFDSIRIDELIFSATDQIRRERPHAEIDVVYADAPENEKDLHVWGNNELLLIVVINLIENALKFSDYKRVVVSIAISTSGLIVDVIDKGEGIEPQELDKIFQPFYRTEKTAHRKGYGIGLALAKQIIDIHKGQISAMNNGSGTTFRLVFHKD
jgi:signal transduction histidine kinase